MFDNVYAPKTEQNGTPLNHSTWTVYLLRLYFKLLRYTSLLEKVHLLGHATLMVHFHYTVSAHLDATRF